ncbi:Nucleolar protein 9 [Folsomia candida]|uniref:Nucleolar protein 9 n=1 Tax=Folsomia candida TaxID=158441 RepID=A0A226CZ28_FOLCA|nr:Nucleolar protein 9 [Folsomia candida]
MQLKEEVTESGGGGGSGAPKGGRPKFGNTKRKSGQKSRLLQKAKKFAKQGRLGRGFEVDTETYNYFVQVLELWQKNAFESDEERETFITNSFAQTEGHEVNYSSNQLTSRVIETILPSASEEVLLRFGTAFGPSLRTLCSDPFASHVVEKLLEIASAEKWAKESPKLTEWFRQTARFVLNNLEEFTFGK